MRQFSWKHLTVPVVLLLIAVSVLLYKLDLQYMWTDEVFSFHAAQMILEKGRAVYDSGLLYVRASIYHNLLAGSIHLFGANEWGSRILNVPFAIGTMLILYCFVLDIFKTRNWKYFAGAGAALLYILADFTIAGVRETRMYTMAALFFTATTVSFYKAFIRPEKAKTLRLFSFVIKYDTWWAILFALSFLISYNTHAMSLLFGAGVFLFYLLQSLLKKDLRLFFLALIISVLGLLAIYLKYHTLNVYSVFISLSPPWGREDPSILYYPILLVRNFPGVLLLSPFALWSIYRYRESIDLYLISVFGSYLLFISLQGAQSERYLSLILPTMIVLVIISAGRLLGKMKMNFYLTSLIILAAFMPQVYLFQKELNEIETYTPTSISIHKKFQFNKLFEYLKNEELEDRILIADEHSAYTLYQKGFKPDFIIVPERSSILSKEVIDGKITEIYFNIEYMALKDGLGEFINSHPEKHIIVVLRNYAEFPGIEELVKRNEEFDTPRLYEK